MPQVARQASESQNCVFYPGVFNETLALLFEAHGYFQERGMEEQSTMPPHHRLLYASEMTRVTMRLTSIMAWLMVRKAVFHGRMSEEDAARQYTLEAKEECLVFDPLFLDHLPHYIGYLSERSHTLFERVARLEEMTQAKPSVH